MAFNRRDVCTDGTNFYEVLAEPGVIHIRCAVDGQGRLWTVTSRDEPHGVQLSCDGQPVHFFAGGYGAGWSALRSSRGAPPDEVEVYLSGGNINDLSTVRVYRIDGECIDTYEVLYSASGILYIENDGTPVMDLNQNRVINGVTLYNVTECRGYLVGLADGGDSEAGCIVLVRPDGSMWMHQVRHSVQMPPRLAVNDMGVAMVVYSGWDSPSMNDLEWEDYRPYQPPVPVPPPAEPAPPPPAPEPPPPVQPKPELPIPPPLPEPEKPPTPGKKQPWWVKLLALLFDAWRKS